MTRFVKDKREEQTSVSFLDVIACAFCAIVILVLILPIGQQTLTDAKQTPNSPAGRLLFLIDATESQITSIQAQIEATQELVADIESESASISEATDQISMAITHADSQISDLEAQRLALAQTRTILETKRPQGPETEQVETELAGIPVDSEYIAFVIDTSGSMQSIWPSVSKEIERFWLLYPKLKGFQIMNDNGNYLYKRNKGRWITDSPSARKRALARMQFWLGFSNSSPVEGIDQAVDDLYQEGIKMAIVVVGDDYQGQSFQSFLDEVDRKVKARSVNEGDLRIHAIGFWNHMTARPEYFGSLMRELTNRYNGAFVALNPSNQSSPYGDIPNPLDLLGL
ncbi:MAG: hypothetical protein OXG24_09505 [Gammaproteobacteria bacterium]|nr:hypothetical protein [Gammaproteobacteria bacterium]